jgi:hypothetical protein
MIVKNPHDDVKYKIGFINSKGVFILHRKDGPAVEFVNGTKVWMRFGELHREDGPAMEHATGDVEYYQRGMCHRVDGPAVEFYDGYVEWWYEDTKVMADSLEDFKLKIKKLQY